tara:strand:+ start:254 stop:730 length:477 start_codon:yes stop_codon:yes gene_type:complete
MKTAKTQTNSGTKLVAKCTTTGLYFNGTNFDAATAADAIALRPGTVADDFKLSWSCPVKIETIGGNQKATAERMIQATVRSLRAETNNELQLSADCVASEYARATGKRKTINAASILAAARRLGYAVTAAYRKTDHGCMKSREEAGYYPATIIVPAVK